MRLLMRNAALVLLAVFVNNTAYACRIDQSGPMPVCQAPLIADGERVVVIGGALGRNQHTNIVAMPEDVPEFNPSLNVAPFHFGSFRVSIGDVGEPITLVLSNEEALIFQIEDRVDLVQRVIVMGPSSGLTGVIGVPHSRIEYTLVESNDEVRHTGYCVRRPSGCQPWQFFENQWASDSAHFSAKERYPFLETHPYTNLKRAELTVPGEYLHFGTRIRLKDGQLEPEPLTPKNVAVELSHEDFERISAEDFYFLGTNRKLMILDPAEIASPVRLSVAETLHGWFGLRALQAEGMLLLPEDAAFGPIYDAYVDASTEWSEERKPPVMAILTKNGTRLPGGDLHGLRDTVHGMFPILVPDGVELAYPLGSKDICYLFETPRESYRTCKPEQLFPR